MSKKSRRRFTRFVSFGRGQATSGLVRRSLLLGAKELLGVYFSGDSRVCEAAGEYSAGAGPPGPVPFFVESAHVSGMAELPSVIGDPHKTHWSLANPALLRGVDDRQVGPVWANAMGRGQI
jgi:hypothetical protein